MLYITYNITTLEYYFTAVTAFNLYLPTSVSQ